MPNHPRSSPATSASGAGSGDIHGLLVDVVSNPQLRRRIDAHFSRLPSRYQVELNMLKPEDILLHIKILAEAEDPKKRPIFNVRFMKHIQGKIGDNNGQQYMVASSLAKVSSDNSRGGNLRECRPEFEPCSKLKGLYLAVNTNEGKTEDKSQDVKDTPIHEIIFSSIDKPKLLSQLSALLSDVGLNIREAHVFSTTDGYSLDVFEVVGWSDEGTDGLLKELKIAASRYEGSLSGSSDSFVSERLLVELPKISDCEINGRLLKFGERVASGSCGDLYRGTYMGEVVAIKVLKTEHLTESLEKEFYQELSILKKVNHKNVVRFIGACKKPRFFVATEYMTGGSLYDYLHKKNNSLEQLQLLRFAIDICKGMDYLHQNNIIHRDLKTANLLMDADNVVKVADFGVARFQDETGVMTAETGTYRWMAPEVINHQFYDYKADVFSFAIVLWELTTSRIPYDNLSPLQAALGVRQGLRPDLPVNTHPKLMDMMQRCWHKLPDKRPSFQEMIIELEDLLHQVFSVTPVILSMEQFYELLSTECLQNQL